MNAVLLLYLLQVSAHCLVWSCRRLRDSIPCWETAPQKVRARFPNALSCERMIIDSAFHVDSSFQILSFMCWDGCKGREGGLVFPSASRVYPRPHWGRHSGDAGDAGTRGYFYGCYSAYSLYILYILYFIFYSIYIVPMSPRQCGRGFKALFRPSRIVPYAVPMPSHLFRRYPVGWWQ